MQTVEYLGRGSRLVLPVHRAAPLQRQTAVALQLETTPTGDAGEVEVVIGVLRLGGSVQIGEGVSGGTAGGMGFLQQSDFSAPLGQVVGEGGAQDAPSHDDDVSGGS